MTFTIYHNSRCRISRQVLKVLQSVEQEVNVIEYLKNPLNEKELTTLLQKLNIKPEELIRRNEDLFKKKFKDKKFTDSEWVRILVENPVLIERPIVVKGHKAIVCRPPEKINEFIK
jgi:arsenate reductase (glutaredoxin)